LQVPKQVTLVEFVDVISGSGSVIIIVITVSHPLPSTIESVYVPKHKLLIVDDNPVLVNPVFQK
jgi:hypothetical protein